MRWYQPRHNQIDRCAHEGNSVIYTHLPWLNMWVLCVIAGHPFPLSLRPALALHVHYSVFAWMICGLQGLGMCLFAVSQQSKPPSSECFESLPCCLWTEIRKKHFGTHDAGRSGAGIASFWVVCCFNNVTPPSFWTFVFQCSSLYPYRVSPLPFKIITAPLDFFHSTPSNYFLYKENKVRAVWEHGSRGFG